MSRIILFILALGAAVPAAAQTASAADKRWVFGGGAMWQSAAEELTDSFAFAAPSEPGSLESVFTPKSAVGFDMTLAVRLAGSFGLGGSVSLYAPSHDSEATLTARIPHPFVAGMQRVVNVPAKLRRKELAIHTNALYFIEPSGRLRLIIGGGLSLFRANQRFVSEIAYHEDTPAAPSAAVVTSVDRVSASGTGLGLNGSVEAIWSLDRNVGVGALARYARGSVTFTPAGREVEAPAGGLQLGVGIRFLY